MLDKLKDPSIKVKHTFKYPKTTHSKIVIPNPFTNSFKETQDLNIEFPVIDNKIPVSISSVSGTYISDQTQNTTNPSLILLSPQLSSSDKKLSQLNTKPNLELENISRSNSKRLSLKSSSKYNSESRFLSKKQEFRWESGAFKDNKLSPKDSESDAINNIFDLASYSDLLNDNTIKDLPDIEYLKLLTIQRPDSFFSFSNLELPKKEINSTTKDRRDQAAAPQQSDDFFI